MFARRCFTLLVCCLFGNLTVNLPAGEVEGSSSSDAEVHPGYRVLRTEPFLPPDFDDEILSKLWKLWPAEQRRAAKNATPEERLRMAQSEYGLTPADDGFGELLGYVKTERGYVMNCLACHGGKVNGETIPGLGNSHYALQTLSEDVRLARIAMGRKLSHLDEATLTMPLSTTNGTTNAVVFGIILGSLRDPDMSVNLKRKVPPVVHHDVDAPPLWNTSRKKSLYIDGHAPKNHRVIMQFMLLPPNDRETVYAWEPKFKQILDWIEQLEPPPYPFAIDEPLAERGRSVFQKNCADCHGTYGEESHYPEVMVSIDDIATDPLRFRSLNREHRTWLEKSWMSRYGEDPVEVEPAGYVAPPLDGIWASAPYFHNGSVPTLQHVLYPDRRPKVWRRSEDGYDQSRVGLEVEVHDAVPADVVQPRERRKYFDTSLPGKSAAGHTYPAALTDDEKQALLEYLKTL